MSESSNCSNENSDIISAAEDLLSTSLPIPVITSTPSQLPFANHNSPSRRTSTSSQHSYNSRPESNLSIHSLLFNNYDSGNFSIYDLNNRPSSISSTEDEPGSTIYQKELREKDQFLFLALQDVRKLKSELERLTKSEKWYKNELKTQKRSRLELLEKLYLNERQFLRENHQIQAEYTRLQEVINSSASEDETKKKFTKFHKNDDKILEKCKRDISPSTREDCKNPKFEIRKLKVIIQEHEKLVEVLRRQKQSLLNDLKTVTDQKNSEIRILEKSVTELNEENRKIIGKYRILIDEKGKLEKKLKNEELIKLSTNFVQSSNEIENFQLDYQKKLVENDNLIALNSSLEYTIKSITEALEEKILKLDELKHCKDKQIDSLVTSNSEIVCENQKLKNIIHCINSELDNKKLEMCGNENERLALRNIIETQREEIALMRKEKETLDNLQVNYHRISAELNERTQQVFHQDDLYDNIQRENNEFLSINRKLTDQIENLKKQLNIQISETKKLICEKNQLDEMRTVERHDCEKLNEKFQSVQTELDLYKLNLQRLKAELIVKENAFDEHLTQTNEHKIDYLKNLLQQQSGRVSQLNKEQQEWQDILESLNETQKLMNKHSNELEHKNIELEALNKLLSEQFDKIKKLKKEKDLLEKENFEKLQTAEINLKELYETVKQKSDENEKLKTNLLTLTNENENLVIIKETLQQQILQVNGKFIMKQNETHGKALEKNLAQQLNKCENCDKVCEEKQTLVEKLTELQQAIDDKKTIVRNSSENVSNITEELKQAKLLNRVIENEHKKKLARYETHIGSLLSTIKNYKRDQELAANRHEKLSQIHTDNLQTIKTLENQLQTARNQFVDIDLYKRLNSDLKGNLTNLMNKYNVVIQSKNCYKSNLDFCKIFDLISKSNNIVPNLDSITENLNDMKCDIDKLKSLKLFTTTTIFPERTISPSKLMTLSATSSIKEKSLMDEFREISI